MFKFLCVLVVLVAVDAAPPPPYGFKRPSWFCEDDDTYSDIQDLGFQVNFEDLNPTSVVDSFRNYHQSFNYATYTDDMYKVFIPLAGFTKSELKVESAGNVVFVEAMHRSIFSYMDYYYEAFPIPDDVNMQGTWELTDGILILEFPLYNKNTWPDLENNRPLPTTTEENIATTKVSDWRSVMVETNDETTEESVTTTEIASSSTDIIETTAVPTIPNEISVEVEETTSEIIPSTTFETVEKETTPYEIIPTSTDITEEDEEPTSTDETIDEVTTDENESYTTSTAIPEQAQVETTVKSDMEYYPFPNYDDSPPEVDLKGNNDFDFYITTSIPLPTERVVEEDHIHTESPFVFSFPKIPEVKLIHIKSEEMGTKEVDPKTQYEVLDKWDFD